jgi:SIR2-like domain
MTERATDQVAAAPSDFWDEHYQAAIRALLGGRLTPFLGAGANLCGRLALDEWVPQHQELPSGGELARYLANEFDYPYGEHHDDLVRISQFISIMDGPGPLMDTLHDLFDSDYPPTSLHRFLASIPGLLRALGKLRYQMIVTTNYDDALERAFTERHEPYDLVSYMTTGPSEGRFVHWAPGEEEGHVIENPQEYIDLSPQNRTVILKIHGLVDRITPEHQWDSFVITEDHYIEYLTRTDISKFLPPNLINRFKRSNFLFLGYSLRDWNLRAILQRIWQEQRGAGYTNWAVLLNPEKIDKESWEKRNVQVIEIPLDQYVARMDEALRKRLEVEKGT